MGKEGADFCCDLKLYETQFLREREKSKLIKIAFLGNFEYKISLVNAFLLPSAHPSRDNSFNYPFNTKNLSVEEFFMHFRTVPNQKTCCQIVISQSKAHFPIIIADPT